MNDYIKDAIPEAIQEGLKFIEKSNGLYTNEDMPAFIAGFLAHTVIAHKANHDRVL